MELHSYEYIYGFKKRVVLIMLSFVPVLLVLLSYFTFYVGSLKSGVAFSDTFSYHLGKILSGMEVLNEKTGKSGREIPIQWLAIQISYLFIISGYISEERQNRIENITKYGTYGRWWQKKMHWFIGISGFYYLVVGLLLLLEVKVESLIRIPTDAEYVKSVFDTCAREIIIYTAAFYMMNSLLLGIIQICLELKVQGLIAFIIVIGMLLFEMFVEGMVLPCHLGMINRNAAVVGDIFLSNILLFAEVIFVIVGMIIGRKICKNGF